MNVLKYVSALKLVWTCLQATAGDLYSSLPQEVLKSVATFSDTTFMLTIQTPAQVDQLDGVSRIAHKCIMVWFIDYVM